MRRWYEPRKDRPDLTPEAVKKRGFMGFLEMLWREFFELIKLNLLFLVTCVPVVTIPAALTAMASILTTMVSDRNHFLWPDYWKAFRRNSVPSLLGGAIYAFALTAFTISTVFYYRLMGSSRLFVIFAGFSACLLLLTFCSMFYFHPMLARVELPVKTLIKNSVVLTFSNYRKTLPALGWSLLLLFLGVGLLPISAVFVLCIMFSFLGLITTYLVWPAIASEVLGERPEPSAPVQAAPEAAPPVQELRSASIAELRFDEEEDEEENSGTEER